MWRGCFKPVWRTCNPCAPSINKVLAHNTFIFIRPSSSSTTPPNVVERVSVATTTNPIIALVGRPNVGKSTLFNRLLRGDRRTITDNASGTTRDRTYAAVRWFGRNLVIVDTGGIVYDDSTDLTAPTREQAMIGITEADAIVFVLDVRDGITQNDLDVAKLLRSRGKGKPIIVAVNKSDNEDMKHGLFHDRKTLYDRLGLGDAMPISAIHGDGVLDLVDRITSHFPEQAEEEEASKEMRIAIVGAPNAGKSSLLNRVVGFERSVVSPIAGTTCDPVDTLLTWRTQHNVRLIDTAGIRRKAHTEVGLERAAVLWALKAIQRAHVVVLLIDALAGITEHDIHVAQFVLEQHKSVVVAINKWDIYPKLVRTKENNSEALTEKQKSRRMDPAEWHKHVATISKELGAKEKLKAVESKRRDEVNQRQVANKAASIQRNEQQSRHSGSHTLTSDFPDLLQESERIIEGKEKKIDRPSLGKRDMRKKVEATKKEEIEAEEVNDNIDPELGIDISELEAEAEAAYEADMKGEVLDVDNEGEVQVQETVAEQEKHKNTKKHNKNTNWEASIQDEYKNAVMTDLKFLPFVPVKFVSATTGFSVPSVIDKAVAIYYEREKRIKTHELLEIIKHANMKHKPPTRGDSAVRLKFAAQAKLYPPTFIFWVNNPDAIHSSYKRFLENCIRERYPFEGTPIRLVFRKNTNKYTELSKRGNKIWLSKSSAPAKVKDRKERERRQAIIQDKADVMKEAKQVKAERARQQKSNVKLPVKKDDEEGGLWAQYEAKPRLERGKKPFNVERKDVISKVRQAQGKRASSGASSSSKAPVKEEEKPLRRKREKKKSVEELVNEATITKKQSRKIYHTALRGSRK